MILHFQISGKIIISWWFSSHLYEIMFKDSYSNMKIMSHYYIDKPILLDKAFQSYWFGIKKDLMIFLKNII